MKTIKASPIVKGPKPSNAHPAKAKPVEGGVTIPGIGTTHKTKTAIPGVMEGTMPGAKTVKPQIAAAPAKPPKTSVKMISAKGAKAATKATKGMFTPRAPAKGY